MNLPDADPTECPVIGERRELTAAIQKATYPTDDAYNMLPDDGSERSLLVSFSVLHGIVNEYLDGGDQAAEGCTCGKHIQRLTNITDRDSYKEDPYGAAMLDIRIALTRAIMNDGAMSRVEHGNLLTFEAIIKRLDHKG